MKKLPIIACLILVFTGNLNAQGKFGILTYPIPDHWEVAQVSDNLVLFNPANPGCRIALFPTTQTIIDTEEEFLELGSQKINELGSQNFTHYPVEKIEEEGWIIFRTLIPQTNPQYNLLLMITLSNSHETTGLLYEANSAACNDEIMQVLSMLDIQPTPEPTVQDPTKPHPKGKAQPMKDLRRVADPQKGKGKGKN